MLSRITAITAACLALAAPASAGEGVVALLAQAGGAYMEGFSAFQAAYGSEVKYFDVSRGKPDLPAGTRTVVAFGGRAASSELPPNVNLVYAMTPGLFIKPRGGDGKTVKVALIPNFDVTLAALRRLQPDMRRLRIFWMAPELGRFSDLVKSEGAKQGIEVTHVRVDYAEDLPALLRRSLGGTDAIWLPPDPLLITAETIMMFKEFSAGNAIPFYASSKGLARDGAVASVGVSFAVMGVTAAETVKSLETGANPPALIFPRKVEIAVNASAARRCGLQLPAEAVKAADYFYP